MKTVGFIKLKLFLNLLIIPTVPFLLLIIILPGSHQLGPNKGMYISIPNNHLCLDQKPAIESLLDNSVIQRRHLRSLRPKTFLKGIVPGTKWCGAGNIAKSPDDLGIFASTDRCCREHDNCKDNIEPGKTKHGLTNHGLFVWSHCDCDNRFYNCLKNVNDFAAKSIGFTFFTILGPQCFKKDYPIIRCKRSKMYALPIPKNRCILYVTNQKEAKIYQWFDNPLF